MKWFKHHSDALDDSFVCALMDEFSASGYLVWFGILELIARENGKNLTGKASFDRRFVVRKLRTKWPRCRQILGRISDLGRISWAETGNVLTFDCPKLLSMQDNYCKNLQATRNKVTPQEVEKEVEKENTPLPPKGDRYSVGFEAFWKMYPRKTGKGSAWRAWEKLKPDLCVVEAALAWQIRSDQWTKDGGQFIPHPATWLNQRRWEDEPTAINGTVFKPEKPKDTKLVYDLEHGIIGKGDRWYAEAVAAKELHDRLDKIDRESRRKESAARSRPSTDGEPKAIGEIL